MRIEGICLLCHWGPDFRKGEHLPSQQHIVGEHLWVCVDCVVRCKTVTKFGLTVDELRKAAEVYKTPALSQRREAMEEAAKIADDHEAWKKTIVDGGISNLRVAGRYIAAAIRSAMPKEKE